MVWYGMDGVGRLASIMRNCGTPHALHVALLAHLVDDVLEGRGVTPQAAAAPPPASPPPSSRRPNELVHDPQPLLDGRDAPGEVRPSELVLLVGTDGPVELLQDAAVHLQLTDVRDGAPVLSRPRQRPDDYEHP